MICYSMRVIKIGNSGKLREHLIIFWAIVFLVFLYLFFL
jgi:hypothetical protein